MPKTLKAKVSLVYGSLIIIILLLGVYSLLSMFKISRAIDNLIVTNYNSIQRLDQMKKSLYASETALLDYFYTQDLRAAKAEMDTQAAIFATNCQQEYQTIIIPREMEMITTIKSSHDDLVQMSGEMLLLESIPMARTYYTAKIIHQRTEVYQSIQELVVSNEAALFARKVEAQEVVRHTTFMLATLFLLAIGIGLFTARMYTAKLFKPLYEVTQNLKLVRKGNMNRKSSVRTSDELGALAAEFNNMTQRLAEFEQSTMGEMLNERNRTYAIVRSITEPMVILDSDSRVTLVNQSFERLFGVSVEDAIDKHFLEVVWQSRLNEFSKVDYKATAYTEQVVQLGQEDPHFYNVMVTPLDYDGKTGPDATIIVLYDITALKALDRQRSDFIATISHEFKTPLTSIVMGVDLLEGGALGALSTDQAEIAATLREDTQRLCNLVNDLLELSRIESATTIYHFKRCVVRELLREPLRQFAPLTKMNGVKLKSTVPAGLAIQADPGKIVWVLNNLLSNAVKYTGSGDGITVRAHGDHKSVTIEVADTGTGIPQEYLERIFDKYVQVAGGDLEMRGSGLGLAVARAIIDAHGGKIWCESEKGQGSRFLFTLPAAPEGGDALEEGSGRGRHEEHPSDADKMS